jgi:hypothetical protein
VPFSLFCGRYLEQIKKKRRAESKDVAVFPCVLDILGQYIFNKKNPIVMGVKVHEGILQPGTPLCFFKVRARACVCVRFVRSCVRACVCAKRAVLADRFCRLLLLLLLLLLVVVVVVAGRGGPAVVRDHRHRFVRRAQQRGGGESDGRPGGRSQDRAGRGSAAHHVCFACVCVCVRCVPPSRCPCTSHCRAFIAAFAVRPSAIDVIFPACMLSHANRYGRQFSAKDRLFSVLSRVSIDMLKENYKDDLSTQDWATVVRLKEMYQIQ